MDPSHGHSIKQTYEDIIPICAARDDKTAGERHVSDVLLSITLGVVDELVELPSGHAEQGSAVLDRNMHRGRMAWCVHIEGKTATHNAGHETESTSAYAGQRCEHRIAHLSGPGPLVAWENRVAVCHCATHSFCRDRQQRCR